MGRRLSQPCPPCATPSSNCSLDYRRSDVRIVENGSATSGGVSKSAKVVLGRGLNCSKPNPHGCEFDEGKEASAKLIVAGSDPAVLLELVKEAFDMVALAIQSLFPPGLPSPMGAVGDVGSGALGPDMGANSVRVVGFISDHNGTLLEPLEQGLGVGDIMGFAGRDQETYRAAFRIDPRVDFRGEAASASAHTTISTLFLAPEAC